MHEPEIAALPDGWPRPGADALAHSAKLCRLLAERVKIGDGWLSFHDWMEAVLYEPGLGYYSAGAVRFGGAGDFITAPGLSSLFGRTLARQCAEVLEACGGDTIMELGPGRGELAVDVLEALDALDALPARYLLLDRSAALRDEQSRRLQRLPIRLRDRVRWLDRLPAHPLRGVVLANEVADALPVHRFRRVVDGVDCLGVGMEADRFVWRWRSADTLLVDQVRDIERALGRELPPGYVSEVSPGLAPWIGSLADGLDAGLLLIMDYGYPRAEYYRPERSDGTLICHYRHRVHDDALLLPGLQDITAFVDFTTVAEAGASAGLDVVGYAPQAHFLMGAGMTRVLEELEWADQAEWLRLTQQAKTLLLPGEMGERFQVLGMGRKLSRVPDGFSLYNHLRRL